MSKTYTQEQLDIEIIKHEQTHIHRLLSRMETLMYWVVGVTGTGFFGLLGLMAHGFNWVK